jgi:hypothetical protein
MNNTHNNKLGMFKTLTLASVILLTSTNSLAEITHVETVNTQEGYPYEGLVERSEEVKIFYTQDSNNVNCRVQVSQNGQIWKGEERGTTLKKFNQKPLNSCMDRFDAKKLLADTF